MPYVNTEQFSHDVERLTVGWDLVSTSWLLSSALAGDPPIADPSRVAPTRPPSAE